MAGKGLNSLNWEVIVQTRGTVNAATGQVSASTNTAAWAGIETRAAGPETSQNAGAVGQVDYILTFRSETAITATSRVLWMDKTLHVQSVRMLSPAYVEVLAREQQ